MPDCELDGALEPIGLRDGYAKGSAGEVRTQLYIGIEIGYIDKATGHRWLNEAREINKMLSALIKARKNFTPLALHL